MFPWLTSSSFWSGTVVGLCLGFLTMLLVIMYIVRSTRR